MKIVKNINNNVAICQDSAGREVVVFAKGIGFKKAPAEIELSNIERTFYKVDPKYIDLIQHADETIIEIALDIKEFANKSNIITSSNLVYSLIDHIGYSIERQKKGIYFSLPITNDIPYMFRQEMEIGSYALGLIKERLGVNMPKDEAAYIALNIVNSEIEVKKDREHEDFVILKITNMIQKDMNIVIDTEGINYSRFVSHLRYLLLRGSQKLSQYDQLSEAVKDTYADEYRCAQKVMDYLQSEDYGPYVDDETLFMTLHIHRLCIREENKSYV